MVTIARFEPLLVSYAEFRRIDRASDFMKIVEKILVTVIQDDLVDYPDEVAVALAAAIADFKQLNREKSEAISISAEWLADVTDSCSWEKKWLRFAVMPSFSYWRRVRQFRARVTLNEVWPKI